MLERGLLTALGLSAVWMALDAATGQTVLTALTGVLAGALALRASLRPEARVFWLLLALGLSGLSLTRVLLWSPALSHLGFSLLLALALPFYPYRVRDLRTASKLALDVGILALSALTFLVYAGLGARPALEAAGLGVSTLLLCLLLMLALRRPQAERPLELLILALALTVGLALEVGRQLGAPLAAPLGALEVALFGLAAYQSLSRPQLSRVNLTLLLKFTLSALPYAAVVLCLGLLVWVQFPANRNPLSPLLALGTGGVVLLVLFRQALSSWENRQLALEVLERGQSERETLAHLQSVHSRYQALALHSSDLVQIVSPLGRLLYASPSHREQLGYEEADLLEGSASLLIHREDLAVYRQMLGAAARAQALTSPTLYRIRHKTEGWRWLEAVARGLLDTPSIGGIVVNARDVTEREEAQEKVRGLGQQLEARLERITALHHIDLAISSRLTLRVTLEMVLAQVNAHLGVEASAVRLKNRVSGDLEFYCGLGFKNEAARDHLLTLGGRWAHNVLLEAASLGTRLAPDPFSNWASPLGGVRYFAAPLLIGGEARGVLEVYQKGDARREREWHSFLETLAGQAALAVENDALLSDLQRSNRELTRAYDEVIEGWARALDLRDRETEGHSRRVTDLAVRLAVRVGVSGEALTHLRRGALLHDIGKMGIPDRILHKPGPLAPEEWALMRTHPALAYDFLSPIEFLKSTLDIPYAHHEKWNGSGYPRGLRGLEIPLAARIFAVVDVWDALTHDRPYHSAVTPQEALETLIAGMGTHFDPQVVRAFGALEEIAPLWEARQASAAHSRVEG